MKTTAFTVHISPWGWLDATTREFSTREIYDTVVYVKCITHILFFTCWWVVKHLEARVRPLWRYSWGDYHVKRRKDSFSFAFFYHSKFFIYLHFLFSFSASEWKLFNREFHDYNFSYGQLQSAPSCFIISNILFTFLITAFSFNNFCGTWAILLRSKISLIWWSQVKLTFYSYIETSCGSFLLI